MNIPVRIGMDTSKSVFQLHGVDENEVVVVRRQFRRAEMIRSSGFRRFSSPLSPAAARIIGRACCSRSVTR